MKVASGIIHMLSRTATTGQSVLAGTLS